MIPAQDDDPGTGDASSEPPQPPALSATLRLRSDRLEAAFWHCRYLHAASRISDWWACCLLLVTDIMYFRFHLSSPRTFVFGLRMSHCVLQLASTLTQLAFLTLCHDSYPRWRSTSLAINRVFRLAILILLAIVTRTTYAASPTGIDPLTGDPLTRFSSSHTTLTALRDTLFISGSLLAFMTALLPLPWKQQLATQPILVIPLLYLHLPVARAMLNDVLPPGVLQQLCQWLNSGLDLLSAAYLGGVTRPSVPISTRHCKSNAADILLLFMHLFIALVLPVYYAYRLEQQHKVAFVRSQVQQLQVEWMELELFTSMPVLDVLLLLMAAGQVWVVANLSYGLLPLITLPL